MNFTLAELGSVLGLAVSSGPMLTGVAVDSRRVEPGNLFVAFPGARVDGHDYAPEAAARGAKAMLGQRHPAGLPGDFPVLLVPDSGVALRNLAVYLKGKGGFRLAAITGSCGKTTTKDFAASILGRRCAVEKTPGNQNSAIGFPMSVANLPRVPEWMVGEMGMSQKGELSRLSRAFAPEVAAITNVAAAHMEFFPSLDAVAEAKAEILEGLDPEGTFVANADDPRVALLAQKRRGRALRFGRTPGCDITSEQVETIGTASRFCLKTPAGRAEVLLPLPGAHQLSNFLAASAVAIAAGASAEDCAAAAPELRPAAHRGEARRHASGALLYDDTYNANPTSVRAALDALRDLPGRRKIALLGDMLELGSQEEWWHREAGRYAVGRAGQLICVGPRGRFIAEGALEAGFPPGGVRCLETPEEAANLLGPMLREDDTVLLKASRGVGLDRAVELLAAGAAR